MNLLTLLRRIGVVPYARITDDEVASAEADNALRENAMAHEEMKRIYKEDVPRSTVRMKRAVESLSEFPFADLEQLMHLKLAKRDKGEDNG